MLSYCGIRVKKFVTDGSVLLLKKKIRKQIMEVRVTMIH